MTCALRILFGLSGLAAIVYEISWQKSLVHLLGASLYAVAITSACFLAGLALGAVFAARVRLDDDVKCMLVYGCLELACSALGLSVSLSIMSPAVRAWWFSLSAGLTGEVALLSRLAIAAILMLPPAIAIGSTFPIATGCQGQDERSLTNGAENLYAANLWGAVIGCLLTGFLFLPHLGLLRTCLIAVAINAAIGLTVLLLWQMSLSRAGATSASDAEEAPAKLIPAEPLNVPLWMRPPEPQILPWKSGLAVAFCSGAICLSLEVAWTRWFQILAGSSLYSFTIVLSLVLAGLAIGAAFAAGPLRKLKQPILLMSAAAGISSIYLIASLYLADELQWLLLSLIREVGQFFGAQSWASALLIRAVIIASIELIPAICMGVMMPLLIDCVASDSRGVPQKAGLLYAVNTCGTVCGALLTGCVFIPWFGITSGSGIQSTLLLVISIQVVLSFMLFMLWSRFFVSDADSRTIVTGIIGLLVAAIVGDVLLFRPSFNSAVLTAGVGLCDPADFKNVSYSAFMASRGAGKSGSTRSPCLFYSEGLNFAVSVESDNARNLLYLKNDGKTEASMPVNPDNAADGSDLLTHTMLGAAPVLLHKNNCSRVLVVGYGSGVTAGSVAAFPEVKNIDIAELEPAMIVASRLFDRINGFPLRPSWRRSGRVNLNLNDGRYVIATAMTPYDAIVCQPAEAWVNGSANLYTREFWQLGKEKLTTDGIFCQWIQLYAITPEYFGVLCRTFLTVFPDCLLVHHQGAGECLLIGLNGGANSDKALLDKRLKSMSSLNNPMAMAGMMPESSLLSDVRLKKDEIRKMCDALALATKDKRVNTDDNNIIEHASATNAFAHSHNIEQNVEWIKNFIQ